MTDNNQTLSAAEAEAKIEAADAADDNPTRQLAKELIVSGKITSETTFAEAKEILAEHYKVAN